MRCLPFRLPRRRGAAGYRPGRTAGAGRYRGDRLRWHRAGGSGLPAADHRRTALPGDRPYGGVSTDETHRRSRRCRRTGDDGLARDRPRQRLRISGRRRRSAREYRCRWAFDECVSQTHPPQRRHGRKYPPGSPYSAHTTVLVKQ